MEVCVSAASRGNVAVEALLLHGKYGIVRKLKETVHWAEVYWKPNRSMTNSTSFRKSIYSFNSLPQLSNKMELRFLTIRCPLLFKNYLPFAFKQPYRIASENYHSNIIFSFNIQPETNKAQSEWKQSFILYVRTFRAALKLFYAFFWYYLLLFNMQQTNISIPGVCITK